MQTNTTGRSMSNTTFGRWCAGRDGGVGAHRLRASRPREQSADRSRSTCLLDRVRHGRRGARCTSGERRFGCAPCTCTRCGPRAALDPRSRDPPRSTGTSPSSMLTPTAFTTRCTEVGNHGTLRRHRVQFARPRRPSRRCARSGRLSATSRARHSWSGWAPNSKQHYRSPRRTSPTSESSIDDLRTQLYRPRTPTRC